MTVPTPRPVIGGSFVYCPQPRAKHARCRWRHRIARRGLARYRRHWRRAHTRAGGT